MHEPSAFRGKDTVTTQEVAQTCTSARNAQRTARGVTPLELATGRRPPDLLDVEPLTPEQLTLTAPSSEKTASTLKRLASKAHLQTRQADDLKRDLAPQCATL